MTEAIIFYDIPGHNVHPTKMYACVASNPQTTRYILNYKQIPYKTVWVEYPDIEALAKKIGAKPTEYKVGDKPWYTLPIIYDPSTRSVVADSFDIALYLDKQYPSTLKVFPPGTEALHAVFQRSLMTQQWTPSMIRLIQLNIVLHLGPASAAHVRFWRELWFGESLENLSPEGPKRIEGFKDAKARLDVLSNSLDKIGPNNLWVMGGNTPSFADFVLGSHMWFLKLLITKEEWDDVKRWNSGRWASLVEALEKWEDGTGDESELWKPEQGNT